MPAEGRREARVYNLALVHQSADASSSDSSSPNKPCLFPLVSQEDLPGPEQVLLGGFGACGEADAWSRRDNGQRERPPGPQVSLIRQILSRFSHNFGFKVMQISWFGHSLVWVCSPSSDRRTPLGRGRAWLRLALMQKKLSDYMKTIINRKDLLRCVRRTPPVLHSPLSVNGAVFVSAANSMSQTRWWWRRREPSSRGCSSGSTSSMPICVWRERTWTLRCSAFYQSQIENGQHLLLSPWWLVSSLLQVGVIDFSMYLKDGGHSSKSAEGWVNKYFVISLFLSQFGRFIENVGHPAISDGSFIVSVCLHTCMPNPP